MNSVDVLISSSTEIVKEKTSLIFFYKIVGIIKKKKKNLKNCIKIIYIFNKKYIMEIHNITTNTKFILLLPNLGVLFIYCIIWLLKNE